MVTSALFACCEPCRMTIVLGQLRRLGNRGVAEPVGPQLVLDTVQLLLPRGELAAADGDNECHVAQLRRYRRRDRTALADAGEPHAVPADVRSSSQQTHGR